MDTEEKEDSSPPNLAGRIFGGFMECLFIVVFGALGLIMASEDPGWLRTFPRFWACTALGAAIGALAHWLGAGHGLGWWLGGTPFAVGIVSGLWWERRSS